MDISTISATLSGLNIATKFIKGSLEKIKDHAIREKVEELLNAIIPLQSHIISLQAMNSTSIKEKEAFEKKLREIEDWGKEVDCHELKELASGVYVYMKKSDGTLSTQSMHFCTNCFDTKKQKSILQRTHQDGLGMHYKCNNCDSEILDHSNLEPPSNYHHNDSNGSNGWLGR